MAFVTSTKLFWILQEVILLIGAFLMHLFIVDAQTGYISLECGGSSTYTASNGIIWTNDADYAPPSKTFSLINRSSFQTLRSFPPNASSPSGRSCYKIFVSTGLSLLRATFTYSNYDSLNQPPVFGISIGPTLYSTVNLTFRDPWVEEIIVNASEAQAFCLITMSGAPVISLLEFRLLPSGAYSHSSPSLGVILRKVYRIDCGSQTQTTSRYPQDIYDRIWDPDVYYLDPSFTSTHTITHDLNTSGVADVAPMFVLQSNRFNFYNQSLTYSLPLNKPSGKYLMNTYFGELYGTTGPTFKVSVNGDFLLQINGWPPLSGLEYTSIQPASWWWNLTLDPVNGAPQINGLELYETVALHQTTKQSDIRELNLIELNLNLQNLQLDWVVGSDPCFPVPWRGIRCNSEGAIIALDLSNLQISGDIRGLFGDFTSLESLNASSNNLAGTIPDLTGHYKSLKIMDLSNNELSGTLDSVATLNLELLNVANNELTGPIPIGLNHPGLVLNTSGNRCIQFSATFCPTSGLVAPPATSNPSNTVPFLVQKRSSHKSSPKIAGGVVGGIVASVATLAVACTGLRRRKQKRELVAASEEAATIKTVDRELMQYNCARRFSFQDIDVATNHFKDILGEGSFGPVYRGRLSDGSVVAIKMRSDASQLDAAPFLNEVSMLSRARHPNLVLLKGYCQESKYQCLVYEYMSGGTLKEHLYGSLSKVLPMNWKQRLSSAIGAATGLEYLHFDTNTKITHRNVKSSNILLGPQYVAKVSDFGLSKLAVGKEKTHITTKVKSTAGYLDPEYFITQQLNDKSDVFSFGVVLMEILCGREPLSSNYAPDAYNLVAWVRPALKDDVPNGNTFVLDKWLEKQFKPASLAIVADVALRCTEREGINRPTMAEVVRDLKRALEIEEMCPTHSQPPHYRALQPINKSTSKDHGPYRAEPPRFLSENFHPR